ncbi:MULTISPECIES: hypothetical protein [unclassified Nonomuraea]|uniref:hypothetical protein n=1 Tax=unclassified Nonomuraea TaxID=2593643 RepID=UPI0035BF8F92
MLATLATLFWMCCGGGCATCAVSQGSPVTIPKPDSPADVVVRAYLAAIAARDAEAARTLSEPSYYRRVHGWLNDEDPMDTWTSVKVSEVSGPVPDVYGRGGYRQVQRVYVRIEVRRCNEDPPNDDPHYPYSFMTGRQSNDAPWKIIDFGGLG